MSAVSINRLTNANIYVGGNNFLGCVDEITLPAIKAKQVDVNVLGLNAAWELPAGMEKMGGKCKFNALYEEVIATMGNPFKAVQLQARANLERYDSTGKTSEVPAVAFLTVRFKDSLAALTLKPNDNAEQESEYSCTYYRLEIDGKSIIEIDALTNVFFVAGEDILQQYRSNIGL
jgi:uncharacterized protein